jgi:hypothetical protein
MPFKVGYTAHSLDIILFFTFYYKKMYTEAEVTPGSDSFFVLVPSLSEGTYTSDSFSFFDPKPV